MNIQGNLPGLKPCVAAVALLGLIAHSEAQVTVQPGFTVPENATLWLKADQGIHKDGSDRVTSWDDVSGNPEGNGVVNVSDPGKTPLWVDNQSGSQPAVVFSSTRGDFLDNTVVGSTLIAAQASTVFIVQRDDGGANHPSGTSVQWSPNGLNYLSINAANSDAIFYTSGSNQDFVQGPVTPASFYSTFHLITGVRNGASGTLRLDGQTIGSSSTLAGSADTSLSGTLLVGGYRNVPANGFDGAIAEILVFNSALPGNDITTIEQGLSAKYGLTTVPEPQAYATAFSALCLVAGVAMKLRRRQSA